LQGNKLQKAETKKAKTKKVETKTVETKKADMWETEAKRVVLTMLGKRKVVLTTTRFC